MLNSLYRYEPQETDLGLTDKYGSCKDYGKSELRIWDEEQRDECWLRTAPGQSDTEEKNGRREMRMKMSGSWRREENQKRRAWQKPRKKCISRSKEGSPVWKLRWGQDLDWACPQGWFFLRVVRENLFHASHLVSSGLLAIFGIPWLEEVSSQSLPSSSCGMKCVCICLSLNISFL